MPVSVLLCYTYQDASMVNQLKDHLSVLKNNELIDLWDDGDISPGTEWQAECDKHLKQAQIILLLISAPFLASNFCYKVAVQRAIERHESKEACVIPVILRPAQWELVPSLDKLKPLPTEGKPISTWTNRDKAYYNVTDGITKVIKQWDTHSLSDPIPERKALIAQLDQLIEAVRAQMKPPPRAAATANTLQQLSVFIPTDVTLADLVAGWRMLAQAAKPEEEQAMAQRRVTCGELAAMAAQFASGQGSLAQAIKTWDSWQKAFKNSDDPRQATMARTFARELAELQEAAQ